MRWIVCLSVIVLAACGGGGAEENKSAAKAQRLDAGLWTLTSEVTAFNKADAGPPAIDTPVGTRATETVCVGEGRPPATLFAGADYDCRYDNYYARNGRVNATMMCRHDDLSGSIATTSDGQFEADSVEFAREIRTSLSGDGDVQISQRVTGRRTGDCPPTPAGANASAGNSAG
jgi:hypothetical protein